MSFYDDGPTDDDLLNWSELNDHDDEPEQDEDNEPDISFQFEHDSSMASAGFGTDEDYGFYGGDEY